MYISVGINKSMLDNIRQGIQVKLWILKMSWISNKKVFGFFHRFFFFYYGTKIELMVVFSFNHFFLCFWIYLLRIVFLAFIVFIVIHFEVLHKYTTKIEKRKKSEKGKNWKKLKIKINNSVKRIWTTPRESPNTSWERSKYRKLK